MNNWLLTSRLSHPRAGRGLVYFVYPALLFFLGDARGSWLAEIYFFPIVTSGNASGRMGSLSVTIFVTIAWLTNNSKSVTSSLK